MQYGGMRKSMRRIDTKNDRSAAKKHWPLCKPTETPAEYIDGVNSIQRWSQWILYCTEMPMFQCYQ